MKFTESVEKQGSTLHHLNEYFKASIHLGHRHSRWNPKMSSFIVGSRNGLDVIDLNQTVTCVKKALKVFRTLLNKKGSTILLVGNCRENALFTSALGRKYGIPFVNAKWVGGTLTNWKVFSRRLKTISNNPKGKNKKMATYLSNIKKTQRKAPDLVVFFNVKGNEIAVNEAAISGVPVIGIVDSDTDPESITYPIPGNDDSVRGHYLYTQIFELELEEALKNRRKKTKQYKRY